MKRPLNNSTAGFSTGEMTISIAMTTLIVAAAITSSVSLQKSLAGAENFFATHMQQIRIIDYLSRDVKRATSVTTSTDKTTVTCRVPNYVIGNGDSEDLKSADTEGRRRMPIVTVTTGGPRIDYGRRVTDGVLTSGSAVLSSATAFFSTADVGSEIWGPGIPDGTTITARTSATSVTMSKSAKVTRTNVMTSWARTSTVVYALNNQTIERKEDGAVTTIASSTDSLIPETWDYEDVERANTEFTLSYVTFLPTFNFNYGNGKSQAQQAKEDHKRKGTTVFAKAYLRNKRRG